MDTNTLLLFTVCFAVLCGTCGVLFLVGAFLAVNHVLTTLTSHGARLAELERITELKPNSRAAMERRDAYEEALFVLIKAQTEVETAQARINAATNILSVKAQGKEAKKK